MASGTFNSWVYRVIIAFLAGSFLIALFYSIDFEKQTLQSEVRCKTEQPIQFERVGEKDESGCKWNFVRYDSSPWEMEWRNNVKSWSDPSKGMLICNIMKEKMDLIQKWEKGALGSIQECGGFDSRLMVEPYNEVFSKIWYQNSCTQEEKATAIEPIVGLIRHPRAVCISKKYVENRDYLIIGLVNPTCPFLSDLSLPAMNPGPDNFIYIFDLGASYYTSGGGGTSQKWFIDTLSNHGYKKVEYFGWEAKPLSAEKVWQQVPDHLKPHYRWMNIPANPDPASGDNPWNFLKANVKVEDYVIVKLDIDNTPIEAKFMEQIVNDSKLSALIDEMFFEHHVNVNPMNSYWHTQKETTYLSDSYDLMVGLRQRGIRFHGWP